MNDQKGREKTRAAICAALRHPEATVGETIPYAFPMVILGNLANDDPALSMVAIDDLGRMWKERTHNGKSELICILDLRHLDYSTRSHVPTLGKNDFADANL